MLTYLAGAPAFLDERFPLPLTEPFTARRAAAAGVSRGTLGRLTTTGYLRRLLKGVYVASQVEDSHELRVKAVLLLAHDGSVITDWSACWLWTGVSQYGSHRELPPLSVYRIRGGNRLRNGLVRSGERWLRRTDLVPLSDGVSVTTPVRTAYDLGRFAPRITAIGGMDALARHAGFAAAELVAGVEWFRRQRGVVQLRYLAPLVDGRAESPPESAMRLRWLEAPGLPRPEPQVRILDPAGFELYRIDLGVEALRLGAEYDGEEHHTRPEDRAHDGRRRELLGDVHGWRLEVFTRSDVFGDHETVSSRMSAALREVRRRGAGPR